MARSINELKDRLGADIPWSSRLTEALTHRSYAVENSLPYDNQRLEFLGDAVLEIALTEYLFDLYPDCDEGAMTKMRSALVREPALAALARKLELGEYLLVGRGEQEAGGAGRDSTLADLFEAVLGAIYLDGGFDRVRRFILDMFNAEYPEPRSLLSSINPKGLLQEYSQRRWGQPPVYSVLRTTGPEHLPVYEVEVALHGYIAFGRAASRKQAESAAAQQLYLYLTEQEAKQ
ncbi:MAG: ribonuclease III [Lentisphaeria bacterium]|nr:ribonuclease III [Lentisphaeria bacterium]